MTVAHHHQGIGKVVVVITTKGLLVDETNEVVHYRAKEKVAVTDAANACAACALFRVFLFRKRGGQLLPNR